MLMIPYLYYIQKQERKLFYDIEVQGRWLTLGRGQQWL